MEAIPLDADKKTIFKSTEQYLTSNGLSIKEKDEERPWGGFFVIEEASLMPFLDLFFPDFELKSTNHQNTLSPKVLLVQPGKRLSWQYHFRRAEYWTVAAGGVGVIISDSNEQKPVETYHSGEQIHIKQGQRHRLVGMDKWGIVAEIWKHADPANPSDENDIVRLEDDFGR